MGKFDEPQAAIVLGRSSLCTYDGLHRLSRADAGRLNDSRDDLLSEWAGPTPRVSTVGILGNITTLNRKNSGTDANETGAYNCANEMTRRTISGEAACYWVDDNFADNDTTGWEVAGPHHRYTRAARGPRHPIVTRRMRLTGSCRAGPGKPSGSQAFAPGIGIVCSAPQPTRLACHLPSRPPRMTLSVWTGVAGLPAVRRKASGF